MIRKLTVEEETEAGIGDNIPSKKVAKKVSKKASPKKAVKKTSKKVSTQRPKSKSGNYKNIRHLMESLFAKSKDLTVEAATKVVKKEFPISAFNNAHYSWYKTHIVNKREFIHESVPKWAKGHSAKIK
jgi:hypothetical protein